MIEVLTGREIFRPEVSAVNWEQAVMERIRFLVGSGGDEGKQEPTNSALRRALGELWARDREKVIDAKLEDIGRLEELLEVLLRYKPEERLTIFEVEKHLWCEIGIHQKLHPIGACLELLSPCLRGWSV